MESIVKLKKKIEDANIAYRTGESIISDSEYDDLIEELDQLSPNDELLNNIGYTPIDESRKRKLPIPMASMNKIKTIEELKNWTRLKQIPEDTVMIITPKFDGLSLVCNEINGMAWTRGDGEVGQLSTEHLKLINPKQSEKDFYSVGEVIMEKYIFEKKYKNEYKNPRNMAAGKMNDKKPTDVLTDFNYVRYGLSGGVHQISNKEDQLIILNKLNDHQVKYKKIEANKITTEMLVDLYREWGHKFELDGIIVEVNDSKLREKLGRETSTGNPCYARAFKGNFEQVKESKVLGITWQISKNGSIKPVTQIEPVELDGALVSNVTAINGRFVNAYNLKKGSVVKVLRSGMVIPLFREINGIIVDVENLPQGSSVLPIKNCPVCNEEVFWNENKVDVICTNNNCEGSALQKIIAFFEILEVDGVSEGLVEVFYNSGYNTVEKVLNLSIDDMLKLPGFQKRKAEKTFEAIHSKMKDISLSKLQHASSNFFGLGSKKLLLLEHFEKLPTVEEIIKIDGFSDISAKMYLDGIDNFNKFIKNLPITIKKTEIMKAKTDDLAGQIYVFTGVRCKEVEPIIISKGGKIGNSVSKTTTVLVMKEKGANSAKEVRAMELGVRIITVEELMNELGL